MYTIPTVTNFKEYFVRDFPYGTDIDENVLDADIQRAIDQMDSTINEEIFCDQEEFTLGALLLAAHFLCINIKASSTGLSGSFEWATNSRSVGSVSVSEQIPSAMTENPLFAWYSKTNYGAQYLMMIYPKLSGMMFNVAGATTA